MLSRRLLLLSAALLLTLTPAPPSQEASDQTPEPDAPPTIPVPVYLGSRYLGEVDAVLGAGDDVLVPPLQLLALVEDRLVERVIEDARRLLPAERPVAPDAFSPLGLTVRFDWDELLLRVHIPPLIQRPRRITLAGSRARPLGVVVAPARFSVIANLDLAARYSYESAVFEGGATPELAASVFGAVVEAEASVRTADPPFALNYARVTWDLRDLGYRAQGGDLTWRSGQLPGVNTITGLSLFREGSLGDGVNRRDEVLESVYLPEGSTITVMMNESQLYRRDLDAGNYEIADVPFGDGMNTVVIGWEDEEGPRQVEIVVPYDGDLLARGELDTGLAMGVADRTFTRPVVSAYQRYGFARGWTVGLRQGVEVIDLQIDLGAESMLATRAGVFVLEPSVGIGPSDRLLLDIPLRYYYLDSRPSSYRSFGVSGGYRSLAIADASAAARTVTASAYASFAFADGFSFTPRVTDTYSLTDATNVFGARASLRKSLRGGSALSADLGFTYDGEPGFSATVTYSAAFPEQRQNLLLRQDLGAQELFGFWSRYPGEAQEDVDFSVSTKVPIDTAEVSSLSGRVGYSHRLFRTGLGHALSGVVATGQMRNTTSVSFRSAVVMADGVFGVSSPVSDSFALIVPGASLAGTELAVNRAGGRADLTVRGRTAVLAGLVSYAPVAVDVEPVDMIVGLDESSLRYVVDPSYRSGTVIRVEPPRNIYAGGVLLDRNAEPLAYRLGEWRRADGETGEFFTDDEGYFEIYGLEPGTYSLSLVDETLSFTATIPDDASEYVNLEALSGEEVR